MNIKNFCDNMTKNNFRKLSNDDQMLLYKVALFCIQNNLGLPRKARYIINKFYERYNCSFGMGCKQIDDFDESKPYGEHDYMTMEECVSKCNMPPDVLDLMVSKIDPNDKLKYIKANPKYTLEKMKQGDLSTLGITYDFTYPITDIDIRWVTKIILDKFNLDYVKPFAKLGEDKLKLGEKYMYIEDLDLSRFYNVDELCLIRNSNNYCCKHNDLKIIYPPKLEKIKVCIDYGIYSISKLPETIKMIDFFSQAIHGDLSDIHYEEYSHHLALDDKYNIYGDILFYYKYLNDLPKSLQILNLTLGMIHLDEIILPENTITCILKGAFSFDVLRLNEKLEYLYINDIEGKNLAHETLITSSDVNSSGDYIFIPYKGDSMHIVVPRNLLNNSQISDELNRLSKEKIKPMDEILIEPITDIPKELLVNAYKIEVI